MTLRECKQAIRSFLRTEIWTDEKLCALLAHAQDKLSMWSCCCLVGTPTSDHALKGRLMEMGTFPEYFGAHYLEKAHLPLAKEAEHAFAVLGGYPSDDHCHTLMYDPADGDRLRRSRIVPIIKGELRRRDRVRRDLEWAYADRETAILKIASGISYLNVDDLSALCELAEDGGQVLAEMVLNPAISGVRLRGAASAEVEL